MGLKWVLTTLGLNATGALAYAVKVCIVPSRSGKLRFCIVTDKNCSFRKDGSKGLLTSSAQVINGFISWSFLPGLLIPLESYKHLTFCMITQINV